MTTAVMRSLLGCSSSGLESAVSMLSPSKLGFVNLQDSNMVGFEKRGKSLGLSMFSSKIVGFAPASLSLSPYPWHLLSSQYQNPSLHTRTTSLRSLTGDYQVFNRFANEYSENQCCGEEMGTHQEGLDASPLGKFRITVGIGPMEKSTGLEIHPGVGSSAILLAMIAVGTNYYWE
ncbi:hypothetical protein HHK36_001674 [Tetracentron sinense]|uniref:Uncharacterized protein n=1 Tax=Tetracentron sinense TaxID=13715 RepID=A0A834ZWG8_TETSI|nr:hypothetical protein HHK36_001674 [Tetracentron sinense]